MRTPAPVVQLRQPTAAIGQSTPVEVSIDTPGGVADNIRVEVAVEQGGTRHPVFSLNGAASQDTAHVRADGPGRIVVATQVGKQQVPDLKPGPARIDVEVSRPVLHGLHRVKTSVSRDVQVRLEPPHVEVLSTLHYVNQGGAEFVVYRATPPDVESGIRVGKNVYRGFPGSSVGITDPAVRVGFFAVMWDENPNVPVVVFARDGAGNEATAALDHHGFPKPFGKSKIELTDAFLQRVVPQIAAANPDLKLSTAPQDLLASFIKINDDLREHDNQLLVEMSKKTAEKMLWKEPFQQLGNAKVEAKFADSRTYVYQGKDVDHSVHLGFDLAVTQHVAVLAANHGVVVHASDLGIFGNCIVLDHGLGVQSLYGHLSSIAVKVGDTVEKGQEMGKSGMTGLAGGDHLHFTMLVDGRAVNPVEWWDSKWMQDRVFRKIAAAGGGTK
jgi:murein DD-endopeptidase MepM/ murein hydrolase activator NlpD